MPPLEVSDDVTRPIGRAVFANYDFIVKGRFLHKDTLDRLRDKFLLVVGDHRHAHFRERARPQRGDCGLDGRCGHRTGTPAMARLSSLRRTASALSLTRLMMPQIVLICSSPTAVPVGRVRTRCATLSVSGRSRPASGKRERYGSI